VYTIGTESLTLTNDIAAAATTINVADLTGFSSLGGTAVIDGDVFTYTGTASTMTYADDGTYVLRSLGDSGGMTTFELHDSYMTLIDSYTVETSSIGSETAVFSLSSGSVLSINLSADIATDIVFTVDEANSNDILWYANNASAAEKAKLTSISGHDTGTTANQLIGVTGVDSAHAQAASIESADQVNAIGQTSGGEWTTDIGTSTVTTSIGSVSGPRVFSYETKDVNVGSVDAARDAVTHLDNAIDEINRERSYIGSEQNKLQFTMSNLTSNIQSIESARSSIEDVDFAAEAADLAKNQILAQSGAAMLAQATAISQNILSLIAA
jgi:flagellin